MAALTPEQERMLALLMSVIDKNGVMNVGRKSPNGVKDYSHLSQCWSHTTSVSSNGYGQKQMLGKMWNLHRLSWWLHNGCPTESHDFWQSRKFEVSHLCDNKACANPGHLTLETCKKNKMDAVERVRVAKPKKEKKVGDYKATPGSFTVGHGAGDDNIKAILTSEKVIAIRARKMAGLGYGGLKELAKDYPDVSYVTLQAILGRKDYRKNDKPPGWDEWFSA